jgi:hypothetical protein
MATVYPNCKFENRTQTSVTTSDMVSWWTNNGDGNFNWDLYRKLCDSRRYSEDSAYSKNNKNKLKINKNVEIIY